MLQRALANGKRAGGGAATSVRVALPIHDFRRPSSRARHAFREIPRPRRRHATQPPPRRKSPPDPRKMVPCVPRGASRAHDPPPDVAYPAPARRFRRASCPGRSAHGRVRAIIPRGPPPPPRISHPSAFSNAPEPGGDFDATRVPGSGAADPDAFPLCRRRRPTQSVPAASVEIHSASTPRTTRWCATWCTTRKRRRRLGWRAPRRNRRRLPRARRRRDVPRPLPTPAEARRAPQGVRASSSDSTPSVSSPSWSVPSSVSLRRWWSARRFAIVSSAAADEAAAAAADAESAADARRRRVDLFAIPRPVAAAPPAPRRSTAPPSPPSPRSVSSRSSTSSVW